MAVTWSQLLRFHAPPMLCGASQAKSSKQAIALQLCIMSVSLCSRT